MPKINPEVLLWARETAGLQREGAAYKLGINASKGRSATERLTRLERGDDEPTRPMLAKMAKLYRRPLLTFYLSGPPKKGERGEDFRTLPANRPESADALLDALLRDIRARQSIVRAALEEDESAKELGFISSMKMDAGPNAVLASIKDWLNFSREEYRAQRTAEAGFDLLRSRAEANGIFVLLIGNLGSHHTAFNLDTFRGFALADKLAPFLIINDQDAKTAWSFTLLHELAHLWIGATGISGAWSNAGVEMFCNAVATEFFLSDSELKQLDVNENSKTENDIRLISVFSNERNLSRTMVAYRLYLIKQIPEAKWEALRKHFRTEWLRNKEIQKERAQEDESGPSYYVVKRHRLGRAILEFTNRTLAEGELTPSKAGKVLGVKARNVAPLLQFLDVQSGRVN